MICPNKVCSCFHHQLLICIQKGMNDEAKSLLQNIENLCDLVDGDGRTLLHYAVNYGNEVIVKYLIREGCKVNAQDIAGVTPLMLAVKAGDSTVVEILIKNDADIYQSDYNGESILQLAFQYHVSSDLLPLTNTRHLILELFFEKINADFPTNEQAKTKLLWDADCLEKLFFVAFGNVKVFKFMLKSGYPVDFCEPKMGRTALHYAIMYVKLENVKILIEHGANVNVVDKNRFTPLFYYTQNLECVDERSQVLKTLLRYKVNLTLWDSDGARHIEYFLRSGNKETVKTVLGFGIDMSAGFNYGRTLLHVLIENENADVLDVLDELGIEFDVNACTTYGVTALTIAVLCGCIKKVEFLVLKHGADVNVPMTHGYSTLFSAAIHADVRDPEKDKALAKIVELLLQHGAETQFVVNDGRTFVDHLSRVKRFSTKVIVAHLALLGAFEKSRLTEHTRKEIESYPKLKRHFDSCTRQLETLKKIEMFESVTLFKLLSEREEKMVIYARNQTLIRAYKSAMGNMFYLEPYYFNTLQKRVIKAKLQNKVSPIIHALTGLCPDVYYAIVYKIISHLSILDLHNLCKVEIIE